MKNSHNWIHTKVWTRNGHDPESDLNQLIIDDSHSSLYTTYDENGQMLRRLDNVMIYQRGSPIDVLTICDQPIQQNYWWDITDDTNSNGLQNGAFAKIVRYYNPTNRPCNLVSIQLVGDW